MRLALLFHFNQHLNETAYLASQVCYRGLLRVLRANPSIRANLHMSGTLITALQWLDPEPLEIIREGLADGQFEIVGSTFAQNIPYATDDWDNRRQIELHQRVIEDTFGVTPTAFWNPERCWRQSLVPMIAEAGYKTITIEDHILEASGARAPRVYQTSEGNYFLNVVRDDEKLKHFFNYAAWFGNPQPLMAYLEAWLAGNNGTTELNSMHHVLTYAEDAEAMGLWGYFQGIIPHQTWDRLDALFKKMAAHPSLHTILFSELFEPAPIDETIPDISPIAVGAAAWMNASLAQKDLPYHEDGYEDWFDFNANAPKLLKFREFYTDIRQSLLNAEKAATQSGAAQIFQLALHSFLTHQYEFGCIGIGGESYRGWRGAAAARVLASAVFIAMLSKRSGEPIQFTIADDLSKDGIREWLHANDNRLIIASPVGGRLLYWLHLHTGQMMVGNPSAVLHGKYEALATPPGEMKHPPFWLPDGQPYSAYEQAEPPPTRMAKFLPTWVWEENPAPVSLAVREMRLPGEQTALTAQQGAFCDEIWLDGKQVFSPTDTMRVQGAQGAIRLYKPLEATIGFRKKYTLDQNTVTVQYTFINTGEPSRKIRMITTSELALNYAAILRHGRAALDFLPKQAGVVNPQTGETLIFHTTQPIAGISQKPALLGLCVGLSFEFLISPQEPVRFSIQLARTK